MNWQKAQNLENEGWVSVANRLSEPAALLSHLGYLAQGLRFEQEIPVPNGAARLLEVGIGPLGIGSAVVRFPSLSITGVEPLPKIDFACSEPLLNQYLEHLRSRVEYIEAPAEQLPFKDGDFDVVTSQNCIDHCESAVEVLREAVRVLKPGGTLLLTVNTFSLAGRLKFEMMRRLRPNAPIFIQHPWTFTHSSLLQRLRQLGLEVISHQGGHQSLIGRARVSRFLTIKRAV